MADAITEKCLTEGCDKTRKWKGLCQSCYGQARRLIDDGETTWEDLEGMGLIIFDGKPFRNAFRKKKAEMERKEVVEHQEGELVAVGNDQPIKIA